MRLKHTNELSPIQDAHRESKYLSIQFGHVFTPPVYFSALYQKLLGFLRFAVGQQPAS